MRRFLAIAVLVLAGCGGGGVSVDADENNVCGEIAEVACHNLYQCCAEGEIENFLGVSEPRTEGQCRDDLEVLCKRRIGTLDFSIDQKRVRFDSAKMNACLDAIVAPDNTCATVVDKLPWTDACMDTAWVGTVAVDGVCLFNHDCAGGIDAFCAPAQKCAMRPTAGQPCGSGCASQFFCNGATNTCAPKNAIGGMCTSSIQCQKDLFCDTSAGPGMCAARIPGGAACTSDVACISGDCIPGTCMGTTVQCFRDSNCSSRCANNPNITCTTAANCGNGNCSISGTTCNGTTLLCAGGVNDVCVFPSQCLPGDCIGDPVCTNPNFDIDYCTDAIGALPVF